MPRVSIVLDGTQCALLLCATFALDCWDYEQQEARDLAALVDSKVADAVHLEVFTQRRFSLRNHPLGRCTTPIWTREYIGQRAKIDCIFQLTGSQIAHCILALAAAAVEFRDNPIDLNVAIPGNLDWYDVGAKEMPALAEVLRRFLPDVAA